jgi:ribonuclease Z
VIFVESFNVISFLRLIEAISHRISCFLPLMTFSRLLATIVRIPPLLSGSSSCVRRLLENLPPHASVYVVHPTGPGAPPTLGFLSSARIMARLNLVSQRMFPLPACLLSKSPPESRTVPRDQSSSLCHERSVCTLDRLTCLVWESNNNLVSVHADDHMGSKSDLNQESLRDRLLLADPSLKQRLDALGRAFPVLNKRGEMREGAHGEAKRQKISNRKAAAVLKARLSGVQFPDGKKDEEEGEFEPEIVFLGTGSAEPSKYRGASAVYVCLDGYECVRGEIRWRQDHVPGFLLDCGEGTWGQLVRHLGPTQALKVVLSLGFIWISHRHADHMSGILRIIEIHSQGMAGVGRKVIEAKQQRPLLIIGPNALGSWLQKAVPAMLGIENPSSVIRFVHCGDIVDDSRPKSPSVRAVCLSSGLTSLRCVPMRHCSDAWGLVVGHETGWSLAYSGDTEPCDALVQAGQGVSVLIHEATFEPALQAEARRKKHSTTSEALSIAQKMHPRATILTHFSQRYPKFPEGINTDDSTLETRQIAVAFDWMHLPLSCIPALSALTKCVEVLLALNSDPDDGQKLRGL